MYAFRRISSRVNGQFARTFKTFEGRGGSTTVTPNTQGKFLQALETVMRTDPWRRQVAVDDLIRSYPLETLTKREWVKFIQVCGKKNSRVDGSKFLPPVLQLVRSEPKLNMVEISSLVNRLPWFGTQSQLVHELLLVLESKIRLCAKAFDAQAVGNALYGLQSMSNEHAEVRSMLSVLEEKVRSCREPLDAQAVGNALYGLQNVRCNEAGLPLISFLVEKIHIFSQQLSSLSTDDVLELHQKMCLVLSANNMDKCNYPDDLQQTIEKCRSVFTLQLASRAATCPPGQGNRTEKKYVSLVSKLLADLNINDTKVSNNVLLHGFEADIVVEQKQQLQSMKRSSAVVNIEVDGPRHQFPNKKKFCKMRDEYLQSQHGIVVVRLDVMKYSKQLLEVQLKKDLSDCLKH